MYNKRHQKNAMNFMMKETIILSFIIFMTTLATFAFGVSPSVKEDAVGVQNVEEIVEDTELVTTEEDLFDGLSLDGIVSEETETYSDTQTVTCGKLNVRDGSSLDADVIKQYVEGTQFKYTESETSDDGLTWVKTPDGWVCEDFITTSFKSNLKSDTDVYVPPVPEYYSGGVLCTEITKPSGLSIDEINKLIEGTVYKDCGEAILRCEKKYNVNAFFLLAITNQEAGAHGKANKSLNIGKRNIFGLKTRGGSTYRTFETYDDCIEFFCKNMRNNYFNEGRTTVSSVSKKYCVPPEHWEECVSSMMMSKYNSVEKNR